MNSNPRLRVGLVGARGHTGGELVRLLAGHPAFELAYVCSRERAGTALADDADSYHGDLRYIAPDPGDLPMLDADAVILAMPNGKAGDYVAAFDAAGADPVIVDLSADYRFDDRWFYGLPELTRSRYRGERRISNPGCYATAMQLALAPVVGLLDGPAQCFGVSGYSGAGTTPSDRNNVDKLRDNLMPYAMADHIHEREVSRRLAHAVEFMPHVAPYFRGITLTANVHLREPLDRDTMLQIYRRRYDGEALVRVIDDAPWVSAIAGRHHAEIGGFTVAPGGHRAVVVATLDNLLKGAATQAVQNLNLAFGRTECEGIPT